MSYSDFQIFKTGNVLKLTINENCSIEFNLIIIAFAKKQLQVV